MNNFSWQNGTVTTIEVEGNLVKITDTNPGLWPESRIAYRPVADVDQLADDHVRLAVELRKAAREAEGNAPITPEETQDVQAPEPSDD